MSFDIGNTTFIGAPKAKVWDALTEPRHLEAFHYSGMKVVALPTGGHQLRHPDTGDAFITEALVDKTEGERLKLTFDPVWAPGLNSTIEWELSEEPEATKVVFRQSNCAEMGIGDNWDRFMGSLKSYLETGKGLKLPVPQ
jgi:uncharacterized protein YndB with AHSA1/START domain